MFTIQWMLGSLCNYDCMYCPKELHDNYSIPHDLEKLKETWETIYNKTKYTNLNYKICFSGGEVTANKNFLPLITWLAKNFVEVKEIIITTNGSASLNYYKKLAKLVTSISFSTHSEFFNEKLFFEKSKEINLLMIRPEKSFHVNIMNEHWNQERIELYANFCETNSISFSINEIDYSYKIRNEVKFKGLYNINEIRKSQ